MQLFNLEKNKKQFFWGIIIGLAVAGIGIFFLIYLKKDGEKKDFFPGFKKEVRSPLFEQSAGHFPSSVFSLSGWKLTLPVESSEGSKKPKDIFQPELASFVMNPWFFLSEDKKGIVFRAPVNSPTTENSNYPRTELREMTKDGKKEIFWPTISGTHTLFLDQAITAVPQKKPEVVAGQIHGDDDDLIVVRLEGEKLFLARGKKNLATLEENYVLKKRFSVKFVAEDGKIAVYYNGGTDPVHILEKEVKKAYFKAGVYTQSNCETEESPDLCSGDNYGEVVIYKAEVFHK